MKAFRTLISLAVVILTICYVCGCSNGRLTDAEHVLTISDDGSGTTKPSGEVKVVDGTATNIAATAALGYEFVNWTVTAGTGVSFGDAESAETTVTLSGSDATIQANFAVQNLTIRARITGAAGQNDNLFYFAVLYHDAHELYEFAADMVLGNSVASNEGNLITDGISEGFALDTATHSTAEIFTDGTSYDLGGYIDTDGDDVLSSGDYLTSPLETVSVEGAEVVEFAYPGDFLEVTDGTILLRITGADAYDGRDLWSIVGLCDEDLTDDANWLGAGLAPAIADGTTETYMYNYPEGTTPVVFDGGKVYCVTGVLKVVDEPGVVSGVDYQFSEEVVVIGNTTVELVFPGDFYLAP